MSGSAVAVQAALGAALGGLGVAIYDGPPARAGYPHVAIGDAVTSDWSSKDARGREHRLAVTIWDDGRTPARLHALMAAAQDAIEAMARDLAGHRVASLAFLRARIARDGDGPWGGLIEYRARTMEVAT